MKKIKILMAFALGTVALGAQAQVEEKMQELRSRGFGARNTADAQITAIADSVARELQDEAQTEDPNAEPSFPGGEIFLEAYLKKKLLHSGVVGKGDVVVSFRVDEKGNLYGAEVTQSAGTTLDTAAFNIVTGMPRWVPGRAEGEPVDKPASVTVSFGKED